MMLTERLTRLLDAANGKRRVRTLDKGDVYQAMAEALRDDYGFRHGGTVANAYKYPAIQTCVLAATRTDGDVALCIGTTYANNGAAPRPRVLAREIPNIRTDSPRVRKAVLKWANHPKREHGALIVPRRAALELTRDIRHVSRLPIEEVTLPRPEVTA